MKPRLSNFFLGVAVVLWVIATFLVLVFKTIELQTR